MQVLHKEKATTDSSQTCGVIVQQLQHGQAGQLCCIIDSDPFNLREKGWNGDHSVRNRLLCEKKNDDNSRNTFAPINQSINQTINQSIKQSMDRSINQSMEKSNGSINQSTDGHELPAYFSARPLEYLKIMARSSSGANVVLLKKTGNTKVGRKSETKTDENFVVSNALVELEDGPSTCRIVDDIVLRKAFLVEFHQRMTGVLAQ